MSIGVPIKLLHEAKNHIVTLELNSGDIYWGYLIEVDDTMNCLLENVQHTNKSGEIKYIN